MLPVLLLVLSSCGPMVQGMLWERQRGSRLDPPSPRVFLLDVIKDSKASILLVDIFADYLSQQLCRSFCPSIGTRCAGALIAQFIFFHFFLFIIFGNILPCLVSICDFCPSVSHMSVVRSSQRVGTTAGPSRERESAIYTAIIKKIIICISLPLSPPVSLFFVLHFFLNTNSLKGEITFLQSYTWEKCVCIFGNCFNHKKFSGRRENLHEQTGQKCSLYMSVCTKKFSKITAYCRNRKMNAGWFSIRIQI